jgi:DNA-binding MarR family transcriptional regulator
MNRTPAKPPRTARSGGALADAFVLTDVVSHLLRRAHFRAESLFDAELGGWDLTPRQKALLVTAHQHPGETQSQLAERVALDRASFAEMLRRMTARGLLRRAAAHDDRRAYAIFITPKGEALLKAVLPIDRIIEERVIAPLPPEYRPLFIKCLKLMAGVDAAAERTGALPRTPRTRSPR